MNEIEIINKLKKIAKNPNSLNLKDDVSFVKKKIISCFYRYI